MQKSVRIAVFAALLAILSAFLFCWQRPLFQVSAASAWGTPASVIRINEENIGDLIDHRADGETTIKDNDGEYKAKRETYKPSDRQWQGLASVAVTGKRIWACWYTGGTGEPRQFNYIVVAYSDDGGKNWVDPFAVIDSKLEFQETAGVCEVVCNFFTDEDGELYLTYMQSTTWAVKFSNAEAENIDDVEMSEPYVLTNAKLHKPPVIIKDSDGASVWAIAYDSVSGSSDVTYTYMAVSKDQGKTWQERGKIASSVPSARKYPESQLAQTNDGKLIMVSRIEGGQAGGVEVAYSDDFGLTWTDYANNLTEPYIGPGSKGHIMALSSGGLLVINHDTTLERGGLTAYLSEDGGKTFPYKLSVDARSGDVRTGCSYPFAYEKNGLIYVIWDYGRYVQKEIRMSVFTESDLKEGAFVSEKSAYKLSVSKLNPMFKEIVKVNADFERTLTFEVGTESDTVRQSLPASFSVEDNEGVVYDLTGTWKSAGYNKDTAGSYMFRFSPDSLPVTVEDCRDLLTVRVVLEESGKGCAAFTASSCVFPAVVVLLAAALAMKKVHK